MTDRSAEQPTHAPGYKPLDSTAVGLNLLLAALWGGTPVAISYSVDTLPPVAVAGIRFALAAVFMLFWCRIEGAGLRLRPGQWTPSIIMGVLLFGQISLFTWGVKLSNSSHGILFINTFIFWVAIIEHFVTRAIRLTADRWLGLFIAAVGVLAVLDTTGAAGGSTAATESQDQPTLFGDVILLASGFLLGLKFIYTKAATRRVEPGKLIFWHDVIGVALFAAYSLSFETIKPQQFTLPAALGLLYQGLVVAGFCFAAQAHLLRKHSASQLSVFSFLTPIFGIAIAVVFRGDPLSPWLLLSVGCVAVGIRMVSRPLPDRNQKRAA